MNATMNARAHLLLCLILTGISARADGIDSYIRGEMEQQHIPGLSMAVLRQGKPLRSQGYGYADLEHKIITTPDTVFQLQSITKSFTATAIMMLVEVSLKNKLLSQPLPIFKAYSVAAVPVRVPILKAFNET